MARSEVYRRYPDAQIEVAVELRILAAPLQDPTVPVIPDAQWPPPPFQRAPYCRAASFVPYSQARQSVALLFPPAAPDTPLPPFPSSQAAYYRPASYAVYSQAKLVSPALQAPDVPVIPDAQWPPPPLQQAAYYRPASYAPFQQPRPAFQAPPSVDSPVGGVPFQEAPYIRPPYRPYIPPVGPAVQLFVPTIIPPPPVTPSALGGIWIPTTGRPLGPQSRTTTARCDVYYGGAKQRELAIIDASITEDETRSIRWTATATVADVNGSLTPVNMASLLAPNGVELALFFDGLPVGVYRVMEDSIKAVGSGVSIQLAGQDRSSAVTAAQWPDPYTPTAGTSVESAIAAAFADRVSGIPSRLSATGAFVPQGLVWGLSGSNDPWKDLSTLATNAGYLLRFDATGTLVLAKSVEDTSNPAADFIEGGGKLLTLTRDLNKGTRTYNAVLVTGSPPGLAPVRALVTDNDPTSPTYYLGPYGKVLLRYDSPTITTTAQATAVGTEILSKQLGLAESVTVTALPDASIQCGQVVRLGHAASKVDGYYVVSSRTLSAKAAPMTLVCRQRRIL